MPKTTKTTTNAEKAMAEFMATVEEIRQVAWKLHEAADDHLGVDPEKVNWAHVGDAKRILGQLRETLAIARNENH
jgi:hypothetical protein